MHSKYVTGLRKRQHAQIAHPEIASFCFSPDGDHIMTTVTKSCPTLYDLSDPQPIATFHDEAYSNVVTMKHGSIKAEGTFLSFAAGSDRRLCFIWQIPMLNELKEKRRVESFREFMQRSNSDPTVSYSDTHCDEITTPLAVRKASQTLTGHKSCVNSTIFHPTLPFLFTSGVEKMIKVFSPFSSTRNVDRPLRQPNPIKPDLSLRTTTERSSDETALLEEDEEVCLYLEEFFVLSADTTLTLADLGTRDIRLLD